MLTRDAIIAAVDLKREEVDVPEWGGKVLVATMTGAQRDAWEQSLVPKGGAAGVDVTNIRARLVAYCIVDESGERMFSDADAAALGKKSYVALERCALVAQRLNGLGVADVKEARGN